MNESSSNQFIIDTWHSQGLMESQLFEKLNMVPTVGKTKIALSSGMYVERPLVKVGVQIGNIKALPVEFALVDQGSAPILFGSEFLETLFDLQIVGISETDNELNSGTTISIESPKKYESDSLGVRLIPEGSTIDAIQLERFLRSVRTIHNAGLIACDKLHQHKDWNNSSSQIDAVKNTLKADYSLWEKDALHISWVDNGSIWISLKSGSKSAFSWLSQIFEKSTDARLRSTMSEAASAEEDLIIKRLTRDELVNAKLWEHKKNAAQNIKETRTEWQETVLNEIDFKAKLIEKIEDDAVREAVQKELDVALNELISSKFMPIIENMPSISEEEKDFLPVQKREQNANISFAVDTDLM